MLEMGRPMRVLDYPLLDEGMTYKWGWVWGKRDLGLFEWICRRENEGSCED